MAGNAAALGQEVQVVPISTMIGGSLSAVVQAQVQAAQSTIKFIQTYGFEATPPTTSASVLGKARSVTFQYESIDEDGVRDQNLINVPFLSIMPIPYIRVESTEVDFSAKIHQISQSASHAPVTLQASFGKRSKSAISGQDYQIQIKFRAVLTEMPQQIINQNVTPVR